MKMLTLATAAMLGLAAVPAVAQPSDVGNMAYPNPGQTPAGNLSRAPVGGRDVGNMQERTPGRAGYQSNTYVRRPSSRTPTDVGNMAFPDPSQTPAGDLPAVRVGR